MPTNECVDKQMVDHALLGDQHIALLAAERKKDQQQGANGPVC
jgi:hypothetical protein